MTAKKATKKHDINLMVPLLQTFTFVHNPIIDIINLVVFYHIDMDAFIFFQYTLNIN